MLKWGAWLNKFFLEQGNVCSYLSNIKNMKTENSRLITWTVAPCFWYQGT